MTRVRVRWFGVLVAVLVLGLWALRSVSHAPLYDGIAQSRMVLSEGGELLRLTLSDDDQYRLWVPLSKISPSMIEAILLKEDRSFYMHPGINPLALVRAALSTYTGGRRQGGSTVTMQLARRLYSIDSRRIPGKLSQMAMALWLEARYDKSAILEAYLNLVPMGGNIEGVEAASRIYFSKSSEALSLGEALALAVIPQHPNVRATFKNSLHQARAVLLEQWLEAYPEDPRNTRGLALPVQARQRHELPMLAPHFSRQLLASLDGHVLHSTLSLPIQRVVEQQIHGLIRERYGSGVHNAAAILIDTRTQAIKAWVGSADFFSVPIAGQVDGVRAQRSPGSTLKPFLYALALEAGLIHPQSVLKDAPLAFGGFQPENHDNQFAGPITAQQALIRSRNVPAVTLAQQVRNPSLHEVLRRVGVRNLKPEHHYGLALALGAGEVSPEELAMLYLALAGDGQVHRLRRLRDEPMTTGETLFSPEAAFVVRDMLRHNPRPDGLPPDGRGRNWRVAWKTGTSWGYRDAWSAGIAGPYVLVVWVGNFDGRSNADFVGQLTAAPLFFRIIDALRIARPQDVDPADPVPPGVRPIDVCRASGDLPNQWCPETRQSWFIPGVSPIRVSNLHRQIWVDQRTGMATCPPFARHHVQKKVYEFWPSDLQQLFRQAGLPRRMPPALEPRCRLAHSHVQGTAPRIQSPVSEGAYRLRLSRPEQGLSLMAAADTSVSRLFWFVGQTLIGETSPQQPLNWRPSRAGQHMLRVSDDTGRSAFRTLTVEFIP